ncbi:MAG: hypothetical protein K8R11_01610 [Methanococcoides sp.]|nr:hypothetical protein [Methanococcoides sp.]
MRRSDIQLIIRLVVYDECPESLVNHPIVVSIFHLHEYGICFTVVGIGKSLKLHDAGDAGGQGNGGLAVQHLTHHGTQVCQLLSGGGSIAVVPDAHLGFDTIEQLFNGRA